MTILWSVIILGGLAVVQFVVVVAFALMSMVNTPHAKQSAVVESLRHNGTMLAWCGLASSIFSSGLTLVAVKARNRATLKDYLGFSLPTWKQFAFWILATIAFIVVLDVVTALHDDPKTRSFMLETYSSAKPLYLWLIVLVVVAPVFEELFFRGFMIRGMAASRIGATGAVVISSCLWALIHIQYDIVGIASIFVLGLMLGVAFLKTGSTLMTMTMHALVNGIASVQVALHLRHMTH